MTGSFRPGVFLLAFPAVYSLLHFLYFALPDHILRDGVHYYGIVLPAALLVNALAPMESVSAQQGSLQSAKASLEIVRGCDGAGLVFLLIAALVAASAPLKRKLIGIVVASALIYVLNELRVIALYFVAAYRTDWFGPLHNYFIPMLLIVVAAGFFLAWMAWAQPRPGDAMSA